MSASSTPSRPGVTGIENPNLTNVMPQLREDLSNKFSTGNSLTDFVHHVYGVPMDVIAFILDANRQLTLPDLTAYRTASPEPEMYRPFEEIANFLLGQAIDEVNTFLGQDPANAEQYIDFWSALGRRALESSLTTRKLDMLTTDPDDIRAHPLWLLVWQVFEFKRKAAKAEESGNQQAISSHCSAFTSSGSVFSSSAHGLPTIPAASQSLTASNAKASGSKISHTKASKERFDDAEFNPRAPSAGSKKRKGSHSSTSTSASKRARQGPAPPMPPPPPPSLTNDQLQLATYALECLDASTRHYVTGVWIDRFQIGRVILILYALHTCRDSEKAGFDPNLTLPPRAERSQRPSKKKTPKHYQDVLGAVITLPAPIPLPSDIKIPDDIRLPTLGNVLGDHCTILETLFAYRGLIGRGTMVYKVAPPPTPACPNPDLLAAKFSWPLRVRQLEAFTIERLRERLPPKWHEHIPEVVAWTIRTAEQLELPRVELLKVHPIAGFEDRILHAIVMKLYGKLWEVGSVEAFMDVWVHCLECHHYSYVTGRVLHRDLSENNLMFKIGDDDQVRGILNDWDMAAWVDDNDEIPLSTTQHRTGTLPFMAIDLLAEKPPAHLYRHDLESFFYILIWAAFHYDFKNKTRESIHPAVQNWHSLNMVLVRSSKQNLILSNESVEFKMLIRQIPPRCQALVPWIRAIWRLFHKAQYEYSSLMDDELLTAEGWDNKTSGGWITFEKYMEVIGRPVRPENAAPASA
ncbi:hypothetical protein DXG03_006462 [Asterophora parasitica]|uniref:Fungal-type protein kinase domain-containing protein n=1 Tax=Asterophora parasitica TaxID=117018 RepID=A0A9P7KAL1_9AGAR|nr:hypothetical protein DXG03_006462 [Asterophora parasitica]